MTAMPITAATPPADRRAPLMAAFKPNCSWKTTAATRVDIESANLGDIRTEDVKKELLEVFGLMFTSLP